MHPRLRRAFVAIAAVMVAVAFASTSKALSPTRRQVEASPHLAGALQRRLDGLRSANARAERQLRQRDATIAALRRRLEQARRAAAEPQH